MCIFPFARPVLFHFCLGKPNSEILIFLGYFVSMHFFKDNSINFPLDTLPRIVALAGDSASAAMHNGHSCRALAVFNCLVRRPAFEMIPVKITSMWKAVGGLWSPSRQTACCIVQVLVFLNLYNGVGITREATAGPCVETMPRLEK